MVIRKSLRETIKNSTAYVEYSKDEVDRILSTYPELETDFYYLVKSCPKWKATAESMGKVYFILNKSLPYQRKMNKRPKIRIGYIGKDEFPTISIDN